MAVKVRRTVTLDADVVEFFEEDQRPFSLVVNEVLRAEVERRRRRASGSALSV